MTEVLDRVPALAAYGITFSYGREEPVLKEVSFELYRGEILALVGPNGCGKSTLLKLLGGMIFLRRNGNSGQIRYSGQEFESLNSFERAQRVAYVPAEIRAEFPMTAFEVVALGRTSYNTGLLRKFSKNDEAAVLAAMQACYCAHLRDRQLHTLSGGERQLVALARARVQGSQILLLDEALSKMDLNHQATMGAGLRKLADSGDYAIVLVSHDMNLATEWADQCLFLKQGKGMGLGPVQEVLNLERIQTLYPGAALQVGRSPSSGKPKVFFGTLPI